MFITWNIMNQKYSIYQISWLERLNKIIEIISNYEIIFLQEVELDSFESDFSELFSIYNYYRHEKSKKRTNHMGNVTLWKKSYTITETFQTSCAVFTNINGVMYANIHLKAGLNSGKVIRSKQIWSVCSKLTHDKKVIVGDFNDETCELDSYNVLNKTFKTCYTKEGNFDFDHILFMGVDVKLVENKFEFSVSDHIPVVFFI